MISRTIRERWSPGFGALFVAMICLAIVLVFHAVASAKQSGAKPEKEVLTLQELVQMALERSPSIEMVRDEVRSARSDLKQVESAYYPQLDTTVVTGPAADATEPEVVNGKITDPSPDGIFDINIFGRLDFTLTQPLYTFGKLSNREKAAKQGVQAKRVGIEQKEAEIVLRVKQLYYGMVLARQGKDVADESDDYFKDIKRRIEALIDAGSTNVDESDIYMVEAYSAQAQSFRAEAEKGERVAYFALKSLIGMPPGEDFTIDTESLPERQKQLQSQDEYVRMALNQRPELKQLKHGIAAQRHLVEATRSDLYPTAFAAVIGSFAGAPGRDQFDSAYFTDEFNHAYAGFFAGLKWHFDFGIQQAKVSKEVAEYNKLLNTKRYAEQNIPIQVANIYQEVLQYQKSMKAYDEAATASRKWVVTAFANFDMGIGTAKRIFDAIEKYGHNRGSFLEALYNYNLALAQLEYAIGKTED